METPEWARYVTDWLEEAGMSKLRLADIAGLSSPSYIYSLLDGSYLPGWGTVAQLESAMGLASGTLAKLVNKDRRKRGDTGFNQYTKRYKYLERRQSTHV